MSGKLLEPSGRGTSAVENRYQATRGDYNRLRALVCEWQWFVKCSYELCVKVFGKFDYEYKPRLQSLHTRDIIIIEPWVIHLMIVWQSSDI
jgi:hypothetical protein